MIYHQVEFLESLLLILLLILMMKNYEGDKSMNSSSKRIKISLWEISRLFQVIAHIKSNNKNKFMSFKIKDLISMNMHNSINHILLISNINQTMMLDNNLLLDRILINNNSKNNRYSKLLLNQYGNNHPL